MQENQFSRISFILKEGEMSAIKGAKIAVFGIGGVGGYVCEALARSGVSHFLLVDKDVVSITNINRQIIADLSTIGESKCQLMKKRILSINKEAEVEIKEVFFHPDNADEFDLTKYDYVVDAIDTITSKIALIEKAKKENVKIISAMGAGNKLNPRELKIGDINQTSVDPLSRVMRHELKKRGITKLKVVYSTETPIKGIKNEDENHTKDIPGSMIFVPASMGLLIAMEVTKDLLKNE